MIITIFVIFVKIIFSFAFLYFLPLLNKNSIIEIKEISTKQRQHNIGKIFWQIFLFSSWFFSWIWLHFWLWQNTNPCTNQEILRNFAKFFIIYYKNISRYSDDHQWFYRKNPPWNLYGNFTYRVTIKKMIYTQMTGASYLLLF